MKITPLYIFTVLCVAFLIYSIGIYVRPSYISDYDGIDKNKAAEGKLVWQKYNCQSCHQLYGLGGYLGPDLTNEYSKFSGNEDVLKAYFRGGFKQMPAFQLTPGEEEMLIEFLKETDNSGNGDPRNYRMLNDGMIEQNGSK